MPRGRWDGDTLVIETTNFNGKTGSYGRNGNGNPTSEALRLVERFTLLDANTLQYEVTVSDPRTWVRPWTVRFPLLRDDGYQMFEYGCHEGNYAMANSLQRTPASVGAAELAVEVEWASVRSASAGTPSAASFASARSCRRPARRRVPRSAVPR